MLQEVYVLFDATWFLLTLYQCHGKPSPIVSLLSQDCCPCVMAGRTLSTSCSNSPTPASSFPTLPRVASTGSSSCTRPSSLVSAEFHPRVWACHSQGNDLNKIDFIQMETTVSSKDAFVLNWRSRRIT